MDTNNPGFVVPAMRIVREYDPGTFTAMRASEWHVRVVSNADLSAIDDLAEQAGILYAKAFVDDLNTAYGSTTDIEIARKIGHPLPPLLINATYLNQETITSAALRMLKVPVELFTAEVLVHEFAHHATGANEQEAYRAGSRFAVRMGQPALARLSDDTYAKIGRQTDAAKSQLATAS